MSKTNDLILPLKKQWFDMIASGEKKEEYREIKEYWRTRFCTGILDGKYSKVTFTLGYPNRNSHSYSSRVQKRLYVHELQHKLRDCELFDLANNFKV